MATARRCGEPSPSSKATTQRDNYVGPRMKYFGTEYPQARATPTRSDIPNRNIEEADIPAENVDQGDVFEAVRRSRWAVRQWGVPRVGSRVVSHPHRLAATSNPRRRPAYIRTRTTYNAMVCARRPAPTSYPPPSTGSTVHNEWRTMEIKGVDMTSRYRRTNWKTSLWKIRYELGEYVWRWRYRLIVAGSLIAIVLVLWWVT